MTNKDCNILCECYDALTPKRFSSIRDYDVEIVRAKEMLHFVLNTYIDKRTQCWKNSTSPEIIFFANFLRHRIHNCYVRINQIRNNVS